MYRAATTIRAEFEQALTSPGSSEPRTAVGEFFQQGPRHFALRFSQPAGDAIIADADVVWIYLPSTAKGQVMKMPAEAGTGLDFFNQLLRTTRRSFTVTVGADTTISGHAVRAFQLVPKHPSSPFTRAALWIGRDDSRLWQLETVESSGSLRRVRFTRIRFDTPLPRGTLTFVPPPGMRVIDQAALLGGKP